MALRNTSAKILMGNNRHKTWITLPDERKPKVHTTAHPVCPVAACPGTKWPEFSFPTDVILGGGVPHVWTPKMKLLYKSCLLSAIEDHSGEQVQSPRNSDTGVWGPLLTREDHCILLNTPTSINGVELTLVTNIRRSRPISENTEHS